LNGLDLSAALASKISEKLTQRLGGPGSGHHGHAGRPGKRGGSAPSRKGIGAAESMESESSSIGDLYAHASERAKELARKTGLLALDSAAEAYLAKISEFSEKKVSVKSFLEAVRSEEKFYSICGKTSEDDFTEEDDSRLFNYFRNWVENEYLRARLNVAMSEDERLVFDKLVDAYTDVSDDGDWESVYDYSFYAGAEAEKYFKKMDPNEKKLLRNVFRKIAIDEMYRHVIENFGFYNIDFDRELESNIGFNYSNETILYDAIVYNPIRPNEKYDAYFSRLASVLLDDGFLSEYDEFPIKKMKTISSVSSEERSAVEKDIFSSWDKTNHSSFSVKVLGVYRIGSPSQNVVETQKALGNIRSGFYHGTSIRRALNIAGGGFRLVSKPKTGQMLGPGIYLTDTSSKSVQYVGEVYSRDSDRGVLLRVSAALGKVAKVTNLSSFQQLPDGDTYFAAKGERYEDFFLKNSEWCVKNPDAISVEYWIDMQKTRSARK